MQAKTALVLGGARSGKSVFAERLAEQSGLEAVYIATGQAYDDEMIERIVEHKERRGSMWMTIEEPLDLVGALVTHAREGRAVLVDCLTLWLTNLMMAERDIAAETARLALAIPGLAGTVMFVSNEVGLGIVPDNRMAREFRDHAGRLNQAVAAAVNDVYFIAAGLPLKMKG
ncbi:bifunctional adenosylcobinamide kinase/adenosylcobinamide-phosphate guanylyltransferase [Phyllobacterium salinisoli]|uniref:Bifunctional adenosylcobalamin biosynthesis protein n=1 Tax=Phyllobacterium salinisoli TaxID=1899321 RepID=A0A368K824_9HYPH|nr:bifunctional adenosylcobinamide kinase/adenosylcobinamide-phosphate guanylyltransferase [Phyllobacterium salinisoli]RCS25374.1 bifunctional adenosylcobinamide kinase/adenosylcobinamide-phosphate guanylyltransferase [Phyllobacterium salinisoli]